MRVHYISFHCITYITYAIITHSIHQNTCLVSDKLCKRGFLGRCSSPIAPQFWPLRWSPLNRTGLQTWSRSPCSTSRYPSANATSSCEMLWVSTFFLQPCRGHSPHVRGTNFMWLRPLAGWLLSSTAGHLHGPWRQWNEPQKTGGKVCPNASHILGMSASPPLLAQCKN